MNRLYNIDPTTRGYHLPLQHGLNGTCNELQLSFLIVIHRALWLWVILTYFTTAVMNNFISITHMSKNYLHEKRLTASEGSSLNV